MTIGLVLLLMYSPLGSQGKLLLTKLLAPTPRFLSVEDQYEIPSYQWRLKDKEWDFFSLEQSKGKVIFVSSHVVAAGTAAPLGCRRPASHMAAAGTAAPWGRMRPSPFGGVAPGVARPRALILRYKACSFRCCWMALGVPEVRTWPYRGSLGRLSGWASAH